MNLQSRQRFCRHICMRAGQFHIAESKIGKPRFPYNLTRFAKDIAQGLYAADMETPELSTSTMPSCVTASPKRITTSLPASEYLQPYVSGKIFAHIEHKDTLLRHCHRRGL